jgi:hypothetical protein
MPAQPVKPISRQPSKIDIVFIVFPGSGQVFERIWHFRYNARLV